MQRRVVESAQSARQQHEPVSDDIASSQVDPSWWKISNEEAPRVFDTLKLLAHSVTNPSTGASLETLEPITNPHIIFYGLDELFPGSGLGELFDTNKGFRRDIRIAAREDFYADDPNLSYEANARLRDPRSTMMSSWRRSPSSSSSLYPALSAVFQKYHIDLTGQQLISTLSGLCGATDHVFGSWIDIIGISGKNVSHSWHQDSGLDQNTVMLGFPPTDGYVGTGVFSHAVKLSHRLPAPSLKEPRLWPIALPIDQAYVIRPVYRRGKEVMVYNDRDVYHSAPDFAHRESLWRFM
jgi:hypothetical protein